MFTPTRSRVILSCFWLTKQNWFVFLGKCFLVKRTLPRSVGQIIVWSNQVCFVFVYKHNKHKCNVIFHLSPCLPVDNPVTRISNGCAEGQARGKCSRQHNCNFDLGLIHVVTTIAYKWAFTARQKNWQHCNKTIRQWENQTGQYWQDKINLLYLVVHPHRSLTIWRRLSTTKRMQWSWQVYIIGDPDP